MRRTASPSRPCGRYAVGLRPSLDPDAYFDAPSQDKEARRTNQNNTAVGLDRPLSFRNDLQVCRSELSMGCADHDAVGFRRCLLVFRSDQPARAQQANTLVTALHQPARPADSLPVGPPRIAASCSRDQSIRNHWCVHPLCNPWQGVGERACPELPGVIAGVHAQSAFDVHRHCGRA